MCKVALVAFCTSPLLGSDGCLQDTCAMEVLSMCRVAILECHTPLFMLNVLHSLQAA